MKRILLVYVHGGSPLEHAIPSIASCGELHILALARPPAMTEQRWRLDCADVIPAWDDKSRGAALVDRIVAEARRIDAAAVLALSEFAVLVVAEAAHRLGLIGSGPNTPRARDKSLMRRVWRDAEVPSPPFHPVRSAEDLRAACRRLTPPILLKSAWGSGSVGQLVVEDESQADEAWDKATSAVFSSFEDGFSELYETDAAHRFLAEEIIVGDARAWYGDDTRYGDYLSVEGIVARGTYHPLCITGRIPTIPPFTELNNMAPCALPEGLQRRIEQVSRDAIDALGLGTCGTHTEIKLTQDGPVLIETAARFGGVMVVKEVESVFGYDPMQMLVRELLGEEVDYPERMLTTGEGAAASLSLIATNSAGVPWSRQLVWDSTLVDWSPFLSPGSRIEAVAGLTIPDGTPLPRFDPARGADNYGGIFFLQAKDAETLLNDCYSVLDNLETALAAGHARRDG
jgi:biotin carboxylase